MYGPHTADLVDSYVAEDDVMADARSAANVLGCIPISPGVGSALRFLASAIAARAVVEVGTGTGLSGLWLLRGMRPDGVLTSIDVDPDAADARTLALREVTQMVRDDERLAPTLLPLGEGLLTAIRV